MAPEAPRAGPVVHGAIVIAADLGSALRRQPAPVIARDVLGCTGSFCAGDRIGLTVRGKDGGQNVLATAIARCNAEDLQPQRPGFDPERLVVAAGDLQLRWPGDG